ncbi:MAG: sugar phosphate isomerase/epimerase [Caldilineaceae bacterium]
MKTRTGGYPIGLRRGWSDWQKDLASLIQWTKSNGLEVIDLGRDGDVAGKAVIDAGLRIGSVDFKEWQPMISADKGKRQEAVAANVEYIKRCAAYGSINHFLVMLPEKPELPRNENFGYMVESFGQLTSTLEASNAHIVLEGWPGPGALCCTPETLRAFFKEMGSMAFGVNYDPSHLMRMNIDPLRFLYEFGHRVYHVHGKDTEWLSENLYDYGSEQPSTFAKPPAFGAMSWRYTIPGQGQARWVEILKLLQQNDYQGCVSIELEDANFNGTQDGEQLGILQGAKFLAGA